MRHLGATAFFMVMGCFVVGSVTAESATNTSELVTGYSNANYEAVYALMNKICLPFGAKASIGCITLGAGSGEVSSEWIYLVAHDGKQTDKLIDAFKSEIGRRGGTVDIKPLTSKDPKVSLLDVRLKWKNTTKKPSDRSDGIVTNAPNHQP